MSSRPPKNADSRMISVERDGDLEPDVKIVDKSDPRVQDDVSIITQKKLKGG